MSTMHRGIVYSLAVALFMAAGCGGTRPAPQPAPQVQAPDEDEEARKAADAKAREAEEAREARMRAEAEAREARMRAEAEAREREARNFSPVYFDYDRHSLRADQVELLDRHADKLKAHSEFQMVLEGHCDERGTVEYNLALGQKRAESVRNFLVRAGVDAGRLSTVSYGKERPADSGSGEAAWSKNRRVELVLAP